MVNIVTWWGAIQPDAAARRHQGLASIPAQRIKPGPAIGPCACGFGVKTHAKLKLLYCQAVAGARLSRSSPVAWPNHRT